MVICELDKLVVWGKFALRW